MTAFSGPDRDQLRQQLAEVLTERMTRTTRLSDGSRSVSFLGADELAAALLPVVEAHTEARTRAARADELDRWARVCRIASGPLIFRRRARAVYADLAVSLGMAAVELRFVNDHEQALRTHEGDTDG